MAITYHNGISVLQLTIYIPALFLSFILIHRHGTRQSSGFFFLNVFAQARIVGAAFDLATINNPAIGLYVAAAICNSVGLSPLLLACTGLLSRANTSIKTTTSRRPLHKSLFYLFHAMTITALALTIAGITSDMTPQALQAPNTMIKTGMILYIISWAQMVLYLIILGWHHSSLEKGERRTLVAVAISAPLILVRVLYSVCVWFVRNGDFGLFGGSVTVQLVMAVLEEVVVVVVCLGVGMTLHVRGMGRGKILGRGEESAVSDHLLGSYASRP